MPIRAILRSFESRNFRLFFAGQVLSLVGTWLQSAALPWLVHERTGSPFWVGLVAFCSQFPTCVFSPLAGVVADRVNKRSLLLWTQWMQMVQAFALAALTLGGVVDVIQILGLSIFVGVVNSFDLVGRQSFLHEMLERREDLGNAIALNSMMFNVARVIGPSLAGIVIATAGEGACFVLNGFSFVAVLIALTRMRQLRSTHSSEPMAIVAGLKQGLDYIADSPPIRILLLLVAIISLLGVPYAVLLPVYARDVLDADARLYGLIVASPGLGALSGGIALAARRNVANLVPGLFVTPITAGAAIFAMSFVTTVGWAIVLLFLVGFSMVVLLASCNTILQTIVDDSMRGRVMSFYAMIFMGLGPLGSLIGGNFAASFGIMPTLRFGGALGTILMGIVAVVFGWKLNRSVRACIAKVHLPPPVPMEGEEA
jgi:MFS family permease